MQSCKEKRKKQEPSHSTIIIIIVHESASVIIVNSPLYPLIKALVIVKDKSSHLVYLNIICIKFA